MKVYYFTNTNLKYNERIDQNFKNFNITNNLFDIIN